MIKRQKNQRKLVKVTSIFLICKNNLKTSENDMAAGWSRGSVSDFRVRGHGCPGFER